MSNILFEDHTYRRLRPLALSVPTYEIRCGLYNTRERLELVDPGTGGYVLCREILGPLHTAPDWSWNAEAPTQRTLWLNGRLAPNMELVAKLHGLRADDWVLTDEQGLLAASLPPATGALLLESWLTWQQNAWGDKPWSLPPGVANLAAPDLGPLSACGELGWIWDLVPATKQAIATDLVGNREAVKIARHGFGLIAKGEAPWSLPGSLRRMTTDLASQPLHLSGDGDVFLGSGGVELASGTHIDTAGGPVVLDSGVRVMPHAYLAGPLYVGRETTIKPGARIFGESSFGIGNRLAGEIGESTFGDFANKQHDGFIGHAVLGSWINLGAMSTCSDLKNNYGSVRVNLGEGEQDTGHRFVGLMMGDHTKTAIGSLFNTGTTIGFASNIFGGGMPPKYVPDFSWGGQDSAPIYDEERARLTAKIVLERRRCVWTPAHDRLFSFLHGRASG